MSRQNNGNWHYHMVCNLSYIEKVVPFCFWGILRIIIVWKGSDKMTNLMTGIPNRLAKEKSPYLLQHAYNPVDWYPWGEEAFSRAKAEDKPIFLSIGYS